ncbi:MAG TPA: nitrilase-related carbon-nitrogen hydrolase, partial [Longimicrobiales bacterium]
MTRVLTLALAQMQPVLGDFEANLSRIEGMTAEAAVRGANMVIFPELILTGYHQGLLGERLLTLACTAGDEPIRRLAETARREKVYLTAGFIQKSRIPGMVYNAIATFGPEGELLGTNAKSHLFASEKLHFRPGSLPKVM